MKKTLKVLAVVALLLVVLVSLTGCGNKVVATKDSEMDGKSYEEKIEVKLKDDKIDSVKTTMTFEDKDAAKDLGKSLEEELKQATAGLKELGINTDGISVETKGKKVIMTLNSDLFEAMQGASGINISNEKVTKDELKDSFKDAGYKVK